MFFYNLITDWQWLENAPTNYGWYHLMWIGIMIVACVLSSLFLAKKHDKTIDDKFIFSIGSMLIIIEIYKQVFLTLEAGHYQWYQFPFQFCSVPMYVAFISPLIKNEKLKNAMYLFLSSFGLLAGIAVMAYPDTVFHTSYITILVHTMIWHSSMVVMGVYLLVSRRFGKNIKELIPAIVIFIIIVLVAVVANVVAYETYFKFPEKNIYDESFYLLYISPYYSNPFPILNDIKEVAPYPVFLATYVLAFSLGVTLLWLAIIGIKKFLYRNKEVNIT